MQKSVKIYLAFCLIVLQLIAPFIHAHAFGHDSFKEHTFHLNVYEIGNAKVTNHFVSQVQMSESQIIGAIYTVANGIKTSMSDDLTDGIVIVAIFFGVALLRFDFVKRFIAVSNQVSHSQLYSYSLQSPRAPPL